VVARRVFGDAFPSPTISQIEVQSCRILTRTCAQSLGVNAPNLRSTRRFSSVATLCTRTTDGSSKPACSHSMSSTSKAV